MKDVLNNKGRLFTSPSSIQGFTLFELIITLIVAAVVITLAVPSYNTMIKNNSQKAYINELAGALYLARSEAVSNNRNVVICQSNDTTSTPTCSNTNNWHTGWLMFIDEDNDDNYDAAEVLLKIGRDISSTGNTLTRSVFSGGATDYARYSPSGTTDAAGGASFVLCDNRGAEYAKAINISKLGRSNQAVDTDDSGIVEDESGGDVTCP